jgi:putative ABC transport system permease protein
MAILGVAIGISAVIGVTSVGNGAQEIAEREIERTGGLSIIEIYKDEAYRRAGTLTRGSNRLLRRGHSARSRYEQLLSLDADAMRRECPSVVDVAPEVEGGGYIFHSENPAAISIIATTPFFQEAYSWHVCEGRFFSEDDVDAGLKVVVLGGTLCRQLFGDANPIGQIIKVEGSRFSADEPPIPLRVVGVMEEKGNMMDTKGWDTQILVPITTYQQRFSGTRYIQRIRAKAHSKDLVHQATQEIREVLRARHRDADANFAIWTAEMETATAERIGSIMKWTLGSVSGIALLVSGITIMNIMLITVTERTREIGLRRSLGARRANILFQFLIEALLIVLAGGVLGFVGGIFVGKAVALSIQRWVWAGSNWPAVLSIESGIIAFLVCTSVGLFFGLYPAIVASRLSLSEALRYE